MEKFRRILLNVDDGAYHDMETWQKFPWHGARWCIDLDWLDGVKVFLED